MYIKTAYNRSDTVRYGRTRSDTVTATVWLRVLARIGRITVYTCISLIRTRKAEKNIESGSKSGLKYQREKFNLKFY
jgi:hypothetical protein